jgi:hypothetical protein
VEPGKDFDESVAELRGAELISPGLCAELQRRGALPVPEQKAQQPPQKQTVTTNANANPAGANTKLTTSNQQQKLQYTNGCLWLTSMGRWNLVFQSWTKRNKPSSTTSKTRDSSSAAFGPMGSK